MSTHATAILDRKVLLALVPLASLAASHEGNPNAHGPINFPEIAQSIAAATINAQPASASSHSTHLTPSLLHGIIPDSTSSSTSTDTNGLTIIPISNTVTDLFGDTYTIPASLPAILTPSASASASASGSSTTTSEADHTKTVWATVVQQTQTQVVTVIKTITPIPTHKPGAVPTPSPGQSWPVGECTGREDTAVNGKCVPKTLVTSTRTGNKSSTSTPTLTSSSPTTSSSVSFTIYSSSPSSTPTPPSTTTSSQTMLSASTTDTDTLAIIPVSNIGTSLINYSTYTIPSSLPPLPSHPFRPPPKASVSVRSKSTTTSDNGGIKITPLSNTVTELFNYDATTGSSQTETTVVVIPASSGPSRTQSAGEGGKTKSQNVGQMLGQIQELGSRVLVHPTVSVRTTLSVVVKGDGSTETMSAPPRPAASVAGGEYFQEK